MKKFNVILFIILHGLSQKASFADSYHEGGIGEIRYSILTENQFQEQYGSEWIVMDGRDISQTDLFQLCKKREIPDARGVFLRGKNYDQDQKIGNPEGDLDLGQYQKDKLASHSHSIYTFSDIGLQTGKYPRVDELNRRDPLPTSITGGDETRPRNITVNIFIKVNHSKKKFSSELIDEVVKLLESNSKFIQLLKK